MSKPTLKFLAASSDHLNAQAETAKAGISGAEEKVVRARTALAGAEEALAESRTTFQDVADQAEKADTAFAAALAKATPDDIAAAGISADVVAAYAKTAEGAGETRG